MFKTDCEGVKLFHIVSALCAALLFLVLSSSSYPTSSSLSPAAVSISALALDIQKEEKVVLELWEHMNKKVFHSFSQQPFFSFSRLLCCYPASAPL